MGKLDGKVALITGASRGIGRGIARAFAREGANLTMVARTPEPLRAAAEEMEALGAGVLACAIDVTDPVKVDEAFAETLERFGGLDLLVNNAGIFDGGPLDELSLEAWDKVIATNLTAPLLCTRAAMRIMKRRGGGRIINIGSISGSRVRPDHAPYNASKHGLWGLTQSTALEGRAHDITCCCLNPGNVLVERRVGSGREQDDEPMITADELAEVALTVAALPPHVEVLEATVIPHRQLYVGRG
jgi:NAD(P)-dependent dehydrogenase (short-subunit alcohol dehydrogenase family)